MIADDVVVVGGGLAGCMAALAAARERPEVSVGLVSQAETTLGQASGLVDVLGYAPDEESPVPDPFEAITTLPADHPYRVVGVDALRDGLALFDEVTGEAYRGQHTDRNTLVPTAWGHVKPTARYPAGVAAGLASAVRPTTLVGFEELTAMDAPLAAERLSSRLPYRINGLTLQFPATVESGSEPIDRGPLSCARAVDADGDAPGLESDEGVIDELVDRLDVYLDLKDRVGFPAILGVHRHESRREELEDRLGLRVFEVPMGPPSVPGLRLRTLLGDALAAADVRVETDTTVVGTEIRDGRVERLSLDREDHDTYEGSQFVLATGGFAGGGLRADRNGVSEPLFGCHIDAPGDRTEWTNREFLGSQPFTRLGVQIDEEGFPCESDGDRTAENLRAAGGVVGGANVAAEMSVSGVSIATAHVAGVGAARDA